MDDPNVNLKFSEVVKKLREGAKLRKLIDPSSFNLHVVHGGFKTDWGLESVIKGGFQLLRFSPACWKDYISITGHLSFSYSFVQLGRVIPLIFVLMLESFLSHRPWSWRCLDMSESSVSRVCMIS